jgi:predicted dehydrogenase
VELPVPDSYRRIPDSVPSGLAANLTALYQDLAESIDQGRPPRPDFTRALRHHRVLAAIEEAASTGVRQRVCFGSQTC